MPITTPTSETTYYSGTVSGPYGSSFYSGSSTSYGSETTYVPYSVEQYDYLATYWTTRRKPPILGVYCRDLKAKEREKLQQNNGVLIITPVRNSPAWEANLVPGDVLVRFDGEQIGSLDRLTAAIDARAGEKVAVEVIRDGERHKLEVGLNPDPVESLDKQTVPAGASDNKSTAQ
jgi:membrane-associated protease RseP (regulator of RpoE activity)